MVQKSTRNLCFRLEIGKNAYPSIPEFHYIKIGFVGIYITWSCFPVILFWHILKGGFHDAAQIFSGTNVNEMLEECSAQFQAVLASLGDLSSMEALINLCDLST